MNVVHEAVSVVVETVGGLVRVSPHVCRQVGMGVFHALVHDRDDDVGVAAGEFRPDVLHVDVSAAIGAVGYRRGSAVGVMPLVPEKRVVEARRHGCRSKRCRLARRPPGVGLAVRSLVVVHAVLHGADCLNARKAFGKPGRIRILRQIHAVPAVQPEAGLHLLLPGSRRQSPLDRNHPVMHQRGKLRLVGDRGELDEQHVILEIRALGVHYLPSGHRSDRTLGLKHLPGASRQQHRRQRDKNCFYWSHVYFTKTEARPCIHRSGLHIKSVSMTYF